MNDRVVGPKLTWSEFLKELRVKFYQAIIQ